MEHACSVVLTSMRDRELSSGRVKVGGRQVGLLLSGLAGQPDYVVRVGIRFGCLGRKGSICQCE
jgi:hypothetical protein